MRKTHMALLAERERELRLGAEAAHQHDRKVLVEIVEQLTRCNYECEAGPLGLNTAFIRLVRMAHGMED